MGESLTRPATDQERVRLPLKMVFRDPSDPFKSVSGASARPRTFHASRPTKRALKQTGDASGAEINFQRLRDNLAFRFAGQSDELTF